MRTSPPAPGRSMPTATTGATSGASGSTSPGSTSGMRWTPSGSDGSGRTMPRYKPRVKAGPTLSHDAHNKLMAALSWYIGRNKSDPLYVRAPFYFDAILKWRGDLSADNEDLLDTVIKVATTPRYGGEKAAEKHADGLPAVPPWPFK